MPQLEGVSSAARVTALSVSLAIGGIIASGHRRTGQRASASSNSKAPAGRTLGSHAVHHAPVRIWLALLIGLAALGCDRAQPGTTRPPSATRAASPSGLVPSPTVASAPASTSPPASPPAWTGRTRAPIALTEVAATMHRGTIWVAGGLDASGTASDRVLIYDPTADAWSDGPALPDPVHHAALVSDGATIFLVGGYTGNGFDRPTDRVRALDRIDDGWLDHVPLPEARAAGAAAWDGRRMVYAGGVGPAGVSPAVFAQRENAWHVVGRLSEAREHLAAAADGAGATFVLGGRQGGLAGNRSAVDLADAGGVRRIGGLPTPRGGVAGFWWPALGACLVGGESPGGTNPQAECIRADGSTTRLPDLAVPRHGLGAAVVDGVAYVLLGGPEPGLFVSDAVEALVLPG
jgi:hypothetical protein